MMQWIFQCQLIRISLPMRRVTVLPLTSSSFQGSELRVPSDRIELKLFRMKCMLQKLRLLLEYHLNATIVSHMFNALEVMVPFRWNRWIVVKPISLFVAIEGKYRCRLTARWKRQEDVEELTTLEFENFFEYVVKLYMLEWQQ